MKKLAFIILCFVPGFANAQHVPMQQYSTRDGLLSNFVTELYQDSRGYLWIGTDEGFSVFDGNKFRNTIFDDTKVRGYVNAIVEAKTQPGVMWMGTNGGGVIRYHDGQITSFDIGTTLSSNSVNGMLENADGSLWCGTDDGLYYFDGISSKKFDFPEVGQYSKFVRDLQGTIWLHSEKSLALFSPERQTVYFPENSEIPRDSVVGINALSDSSVAISVIGPIVYIVKELSVVKKLHLPTTAVQNVVLDDEGQYWMTTPEGIYTHQQIGSTVRERLLTTANGIPANDMNLTFRDRENNLWFSSSGKGLMKIEAQPPIQFSFPGMSGKAVVDSTGHVWIASSNGLYELWQDATSRWQNSLHLLGSINHRIVPVAIAFDPSDRIWITALDGSLRGFSVNRKDHAPSVVTLQSSLTEHDGFPKALSVTLLADSKNIVWYCMLNGGLVGVDVSHHPTITARFDYPHQTRLRDIRELYEDKTGTIWALGFDPATEAFKQKNDMWCVDSANATLAQLPDGIYRSIAHTNDGAFWFGSRYNGLFRILGDSVRRYSLKDGMISNQIWTIAETSGGGLLIGSQAGLMFIPDIQDVHFTSFQQLTQSPVRVVEEGKEFSFAITHYEMTIFKTPRAITEREFPPVLFTSLNVNGKEHAIGDAIELSHDENTLSIDFTAVTFRNTGALRFQYKLDPVESEWREITTQRSVTYAGLSPNNYVFMVRVVNQDGKTSEVPGELHFTIASPIWMRWWFVSVVILCLTGGIIFVERIRVRRLLEIEKIRSRIAADLHDDIGSGLTRIALLSDMIKRQSIAETNTDNDQFSVSSLTEKVGAISRELVDAMIDVVWSIDPKNNSMEKLLHRVQTFATEVCEAKEIELTFSAAKGVNQCKVGSDSIRAVLLVAKEALANIARHSDARNTVVSFSMSNHQLLMEICDDGKGFVIEELSRMNGLTNMQTRIEKNGGTFTVTGVPGGGTGILATIPLPQ
ncbi:MAG: histidine kinase [Bacteroidetes bacterium]|nr:histidine kinase [Bacteroidota bacterium]